MNRITILSLIVGCVLFSTNSQAQEFPEVDKSVMDMAYYPPRVALRAFAKTDEEKNAKPVMRVTYSRPLKNDRNIFGELVKYGEMWRAGANESTELLLLQAASVGGTKLSAGRYTINVMVNNDEWTVYISNELDAWGHYSFDAAKDTAAKINVKPTKTSDVVEAFSIVFEKSDKGANMIMAWDDTMVSVPFVF